MLESYMVDLEIYVYSMQTGLDWELKQTHLQVVCTGGKLRTVMVTTTI